MALLTNLVKKRLDVPGTEGDWIEIRKLGWRKLQEASDVQQRNAYQYVKVLGKDGLDAVKSVSAEAIAEYRSNPTAQYDAATVLRAGVVAWSLGDRVTPEELDELDSDTATWLVQEILTLARPARDEAASKNG